MWSSFLEENFRSTGQIMDTFGCDYGTAVHWLNRSTLPRMPYLVGVLRDRRLAPPLRSKLLLAA
jgi:hypothetical protein